MSGEQSDGKRRTMHYTIKKIDAGTQKVKQLRPNMQAISCTFILIDKEKPVHVPRKNRWVSRALVADETGSIRLSLWNEFIDAFQPGDIINLHNGCTQVYQNQMMLYVGKGKLQRIDEFCMLFSEKPNMSHQSFVQDPSRPQGHFMLKPTHPQQQQASE
eukprot:gb/GEZN01017452.1/.p1 GENE.gb/GEZN01017452.1/~~gb/GEZN01017452.1/.p1  ORF type:complete len:159 (-),score=21.02 gb/GEZN01017452.1/:223-699(-)